MPTPGPHVHARKVSFKPSHEGELEEIRTRNISIKVSRRAGWDWQVFNYLGHNDASQMVHDKETGCLLPIRVLWPPTSWVIPIFLFHIHQVFPCSSSSIPNIHHVFPHYQSQVLASHVPCAEPVSDRRNLVGYGSYCPGVGYLT